MKYINDYKSNLNQTFMMSIAFDLKFVRQLFKWLLPLSLAFLFSGQTAYAQDSGLVTLNMQDVSVEKVLNSLKSKYGLSFVIRTDGIDLSRKVSISVRNEPLSSVLDRIFSSQGIKTEINDNVIRLSKQGVASSKLEPYRITGKVLDGTGTGVPGASVFEKGTSNGTTTDLDGNWSLEIEGGATLLECACLGYEPKEMAITEKMGSVNFILRESAEFLDEVVVVGYGTMKRSLVSSAISRVEIDESNMREVSSPTALLNGRIAGVTSFASSGALGAGERVSIRGASSIQAGNDPLYVIDGILIDNSNANLYNFGENMSPLAVLNVADIESIEVLKDAASASIYGSRASNGVVVITTKSGKKGKSILNVNLSAGINQFPNIGRLQMANTEEYLKQYNIGIDNYNAQTGSSLEYLDPGTTETTDWLSYAVQLGNFWNANLSFSGGNEKTNFYIGGSYNHNKGIIKTNKLDKFNFKARIDHKFNDWLEVGANTSANYMKNHQVPGVSLGSMILGRCVLQRPFDKAYHDDGTYTVGGTNELTYHNPAAILNEANTFLESYRFLGSYYFTLKFLDDRLTFKNTLSTDVTYNRDYKHYSSKHPYVKTFGLVDANKLIRNIVIDNVLSYNDTFLNDSFGFSAMLGHSLQMLDSDYKYMLGKGFPSDAFDAMGAAASIDGYDGQIMSYAMESFFGRVNFSYKDRYTLTGSLRTDGSSKFARDYRWGWFPSVSFGWNVSNEEFMKGSGIDMKVRVSYGKTGNQEGIDYYAYLAKMDGGYNYEGIGGIAVTDFGNSGLTWEKAGQWDAGFDLGFFDNRLTLIFDAYYKKTTDLLYAKPIYTTSGVSSIISNVGSMENKGLELTIGGEVDFGPVHWSTNFNISTNANRILSLVGDEDIIIGANNSTTYGTQRILRVGEELGAFYLYKHDGIYQSDSEVPATLYAKGYRAGDIKYRDINSDGNLTDTDDRMVIGSPTPDFQGGWSNTFSFKNWTLDLFFTYMYGNDVYSGQEFNYSRRAYKANITKEHATHYWTPGSGENWYPRPYYNSTLNTLNSDFFLHDGSFLRLRNLTLAYNFPTSLLSKARISSLRVYFSVDNVFLVSKYPGWDPEVNTNNDARYIGVDNLNIPQPRIYSFGVNLSL